MEPEKLRQKVLDIITDDFDYFRENPKHLAWAMMNFRLIHTISRIVADRCHDNPKYLIQDVADAKLKNKTDADLFYDAWAVSASNEIAFPDTNPNLPLESKPNKTLDEWVELFTDKRYEYNGLFPNKWRVADNLLCVIGTGMDWNKDGFITDAGPSNVDEIIFSGYTRAEDEIRKDLKIKIKNLTKDKVIAKGVEDYMRKVAINAGNNQAEKNILNESWKVKKTLRGFPKEEVEKALKQFEYTCYFETLINQAKHWTEKQWKQARKSNKYTYKGKEIDISEVHIGFAANSYSFCHDTEMSRNKIRPDYRVRGILNERYHKWSNFVYQLDKSTEAFKTAEALTIVLKDNLAFLKRKKDEPEPEEVQKARDFLDTQRPNLEKYKPVLEKAAQRDSEAIETLNELAEVPAKGWDSIEYLVLKDKNLFKDVQELEKKLGIQAPKKKSRTHYPICEFSNMVTMPDNAHTSYVQAGLEIAKEIVANPDEPEYAQKDARAFLKKWGEIEEKILYGTEIRTNPVREREAILRFLDQHWNVNIKQGKSLREIIGKILDTGIKTGISHRKGGVKKNFMTLSGELSATAKEYFNSVMPKGYTTFKRKNKDDVKSLSNDEELDFQGISKQCSPLGAGGPGFAGNMTKIYVLHNDKEQGKNPARTLVESVLKHGINIGMHSVEDRY